MRLMFFLGMLLLSSLTQAKTDVLFLNPGSSDESFWGDVDSLLVAAAIRFDMEVETLHSNRNHFDMIRQANEVAQRPDLPPYVFLVNEKQSGLRMLDAFYHKPVYVQFVLNDISPAERQTLLQDPHWHQYLLPPVVPDNRTIGFETAGALVQGLGGKDIQVVLVSGDKSTPASVERTEGALAALQSMAEVSTEQTVYGQWQENKAYQQAQVLLQRYPGLDAIWTANDHMAFGVIRAMKEKRLAPGKKIRIATINTSAEVLALRREGAINVLGGGHFLAGGVALSNVKQHMDTGSYPTIHYSLFRLLEPDTEFFIALERRDWELLLDIALTRNDAPD
ncbi:ABC transporter substrate-binding protein [Shewanella khirikhana]|uniref:D-allose-binding periplasmic protein n=1 Tax=Shewanella khirikhana TaxID=1965282 RepID=A0ABM7DRF1_9GAMM|nr:ABC transporter substrate-binding protein [Shewanella khirikhana]AZQ12275.1 D-allose-binding periplasmic protein precursor [Shewanella khirikhana]